MSTRLARPGELASGVAKLSARTAPRAQQQQRMHGGSADACTDQILSVTATKNIRAGAAVLAAPSFPWHAGESRPDGRPLLSRKVPVRQSQLKAPDGPSPP